MWWGGRGSPQAKLQKVPVPPCGYSGNCTCPSWGTKPNRVAGLIQLLGHKHITWGEVSWPVQGQHFLVVVYDCEFTLCLQITLFTIPRRKKKCIRYLPGEGRCPSPVPSDDSALGCPRSPAPQDSPLYLLSHFPTELLASPVELAPTSPGLSTGLSLPAPERPQSPHSTLQNTQVQQQESQRQAA